MEEAIEGNQYHAVQKSGRHHVNNPYARPARASPHEKVVVQS